MVLLKFAFVLWSFANDSLHSLILPFLRYNILTCDVTEICLSTHEMFLFLLNMGKQKIWAITVTNIRPAFALLLLLTAVLMRTESYKYESVFIWNTLLKLNYLFILFYKTINLFIMNFCQSPSYNWANACLHRPIKMLSIEEHLNITFSILFRNTFWST